MAAILFLTPIVVLVALELILRATNYGGNLDLVIRKQINGKEYYSINRAVGARYFAYAGTVIPEPADDIFEVSKSTNTIRIFCLGESTMAGFPYEFNATAPSFMRDRLRALFPQHKIEVVNVGLSAISSYIVVDFVNELKHYQPDLFLVYLGHNEFYGIYGAGSTVTIPGGRWLTKLTIGLLRYKTFLALRSILGWIQNKSGSSSTKADATLMEQMVREQSIPYGSTMYRSTEEAYRTNLEAIIAATQATRIPVLFSTLVSNLKDHAPFRSLFAPGTSQDARDGRQKLISAGDSSYVQKDYGGAQKSYQQCVALDTTNALAYYKLGQANYELGEYVEAKRDFARARDLDGLRFRASEDFQNELISVCTSNGVPLARVDSAFETNSPHGIIDKKLMLEHLHPNLDGYFLMGKTFASAIVQHKLLTANFSASDSKPRSDSEYWALSGTTDFDRLMGTMKVSLLTHKWPFTSSGGAFTIVPNNEVETIVLKYVEGRTYWSDARYELAEYYRKEQQFEPARNECFAVSKVIPFSYQPLLRIADYYLEEGLADSAKAAYERCIQAQDNPYARMKLAVILLEGEKPSEAERQISIGLKIADESAMKLDRDATALSYYFLGVAYAKQGKFGQAKEILQRSVSIKPTLQEAHSLLQQLSQVK